MSNAAPAVRRPGRARLAANFVLFQAAWLAAVLGAANGRAAAGSLCVVGVIVWHLAVSARPGREALLVGAVVAIGCGVETLQCQFGHTVYRSGQPWPGLPPYWLVSLWGLFAVTLNVTLRWLKGRPLLAALLGAVAGPLSFASGVRLGAASFVDARAALLVLAGAWAVTMPALMWLSDRFDGVVAGAAGPLAPIGPRPSWRARRRANG